jgi:hypothetical protein
MKRCGCCDYQSSFPRRRESRKGEYAVRNGGDGDRVWIPDYPGMRRYGWPGEHRLYDLCKERLICQIYV